MVRVRGVGREGVWCAGCVAGALPFVGIVGEGDYRGALREYREGVGSRAGDFRGARFDPFDEETRGVTRDLTLRGCAYRGGMRSGVGSGGWARWVGVPFPFFFIILGVRGGLAWSCWRLK